LDGLNNPLGISEDVIVPKPKNPKALRFEPSGPLLVMFGAFPVLPAVNLDDEADLQADEIDHICAERHLAAKSMSFELPLSKSRP